MKAAVILTGQARTFSKTFPSLNWQVFRNLPDPTFYVSVADDEHAKSVEILREKYPENTFIEYVQQPTLPEPPMALTAHAPYAITPTKTPGVGPLQGICRQLWHLSRGYKFAAANGLEQATMVVRCRFDLHFHSFSYVHPMTYEAWTPWWGNYGGVNDRFAILGCDAAKAYFETWDKVPDLLNQGAPFHPETLVCESMAQAGIRIYRRLPADFAMIRTNGETQHMTVLPSELAQISLTR